MALAQKDFRRLELVHAPVGLDGAPPHAARHAEVRQLEAEAAAGVVVGGRLDDGRDRGGGGVAAGGDGGGGGCACVDGGGGRLGGGRQEDAGRLQISVDLPNVLTEAFRFG